MSELKTNSFLGVTEEDLIERARINNEVVALSQEMVKRPLVSFSFSKPEEMAFFLNRLFSSGIICGHFPILQNVDINFFHKVNVLTPDLILCGLSDEGQKNNQGKGKEDRRPWDPITSNTPPDEE